MSIIKQLATYDGSTWTVDDIGADASNISLTTNVAGQTNVQSALSKIIGTSALTEKRAVITGTGGVLTTSTVTNTELNYLSGTTSNIQTQINTLKEYIIVTPEMYGAKGDGINNDTDAIQTCFENNPNSIIVFQDGEYLIEDEITIYGNQGGQTVIFGGAKIKWNGDQANDLAMFHINRNLNNESRTLIIGGTFDGNNLVGCAIKSNRYHVTISDCKILDVTKEGIAIGTSGTGRSLQNIIRNCIIMMSANSSQGWSESNNVVGVALYEPDGFISDLNINRCKTGVLLESSGYEFTNCHFTTEYTAQQENMADTNGVVIAPLSTTSINVDTFINCYFDNVKYCFYAMTTNRRSIHVVNSHYFNSGNQTSEIVEAFMVGGNSINIIVDNFTVVPVGGKCRFYDATFCQGMSMQMMDMIKQNYHHTIYSLQDEAKVPYTAAHLFNSGESGMFIRSGNQLNSSLLLEIGCLVVNGSVGLANTITLHYRNRTYGSADIILRYLTSSNKWEVVNKEILIKDSGMRILIDNGTDVTINEQTKKVFRLYFNNKNTTLTSTNATISCEYHTPITFYINNESTVILDLFDENDYTIIDLGDKSPVGNTYRVLSDINADLNKTLGELCDLLPNGTKFEGFIRKTNTGELYNSLPTNFDYCNYTIRKDVGTNTCFLEVLGHRNGTFEKWINSNGSTGGSVLGTWVQL